MSRETLAEINHFKHYLLVVSRNQAFDVLKKQLKEKLHKRDWEKANKSTQLVTDNDTEKNNLSLIDKAIDSLPPRRKEVYLLSRHERLSYKEIAEQLGISRESVKTHLQLASASITHFIRTHLATLTLFLLALPPFSPF